MMEVEEAAALLQNEMIRQQETERVPLMAALGRVIGEEVVAAVNVPSFPRSGMDGYAVYGAACRSTFEKADWLPVIGTIYAGDSEPISQGRPGTAVKIMTGGAIPAGYDTVVRQEDVVYCQGQIRFLKPVVKGSNYGQPGEDIKCGQLLLSKYTYVTCEALGVLASLGYTEVLVLKRLRVGLISTGNELTAVGEPLAAGQIYNNLGCVLAAYIQQTGGQVVYEDICPDEPQALAALLDKYQGATDLVITTGGVSVGAKDLVPEGLALAGAKELFHGVNMKPGTPVMAASRQGRPILALSGNPFAAIVNFHMFYWPLAAHFYNSEHFQLRKHHGKIISGAMPVSRLRRFVRAQAKEGEIHLVDLPQQRSAVFHNLLTNNCLVEQPAGQPLKAGDEAVVYLWPQSYLNSEALI